MVRSYASHKCSIDFYPVKDTCRSALVEGGVLGVLLGMLRDNDTQFRVLSLKAIAKLAKYGKFRAIVRIAPPYSNIYR